MKKNISILLFGFFVIILLSACSSQNNKTTPINEDNSITNIQQVSTGQTTISTDVQSESNTSSIQTVNPLDEDTMNYTYLKFTATNEIVAPVNQSIKDRLIKSESTNSFAPQFVNDKNEIALALKRVTSEQAKPLNIGKFTVYFTNNGEFIANKGDSREKSICRTGGGVIQYGQPFTNKNGDLFFYSNMEIFHLASGSNNVDCITIGQYHWFSSNSQYLATLDLQNDERVYVIFDLENMLASEIRISNSIFQAQTYTPNNFIIGDKGELVICDGLLCGVGDMWANTTCNVLVTAINAKNIYKANFSGIPLFLCNDYLLFTDKMQMNKISISGISPVLKYLDFKQPFYKLTVEKLSSDVVTNLFGSTYHYRSNQCTFSEEGSFFQDTPAYNFDFNSITLSKVKYDRAKNEFVKQ